MDVKLRCLRTGEEARTYNFTMCIYHLKHCCMYCMYEGRSESRERFCHTKTSTDNRKETEYAGFIIHFHLLLHIVTLDIEALVP